HWQSGHAATRWGSLCSALLARPRVAYTRGQTAMADALYMDRMFQRIMRGLVDTGRAPHYAELARALGLPVEEGRLLLHDVMRAYPIGWLHPETDYIASFPPLNNLPTQYRITVRGAQRWFAQCGFEATSVLCSLPGEPGRVEPPCLVCGARGRAEMGAGRIPWVDPPGVGGTSTTASAPPGAGRRFCERA